MDYTAIASSVDSIMQSAGAKLTLTAQPEGTTSGVYGVFLAKKSEYEANTTTQYQHLDVLVSPKLKVVPKPGDWLTRGSSADRYVVKTVETIAPSGTIVVYKLGVMI